MMLLVIGQICASVADYWCTNVGELERDFRCGQFREALTWARA
jgi:hypothetical protein